MDKIPSVTPIEEKSNAEIRRDLRKTFEKSLSEKEPDKLQLNDIMLGILVVIAAAISFTDFTLSFSNIKNFTALTIFLFVITSLVYRNRYARGIQRGKTDKDYLNALNDYRTKRAEVYSKGLAGLVPDFCREYRARELREYRESLLVDIDMDYETYRSQWLGKSKRYILKSDFSAYIKQTLIKCNEAKPLKLAPGLILNESGEMDREKLVGQSGREREIIDKRAQIIQRAIMVLFGSVIAINIILDFSLLTIFQWLVRMLPVVAAIITGDDSGYCCVTVTETKFKRDQTHIINLFFENVAEKKAEKERQLLEEAEKIKIEEKE